MSAIQPTVLSFPSIAEVNAEKRARFFDKLGAAFRLVRTEEHMEIIEEVIALYNIKQQAIKKLPRIQQIFEECRDEDDWCKVSRCIQDCNLHDEGCEHCQMVSEYSKFWDLEEEAVNNFPIHRAPELECARDALVDLLHD
ncbi:hypothetical protein N7474_007257 [Penicillium riverlandense]|uniref:uncharacterized protein n=1 Tax=Penicillium riverlandense TaxID=1903569 RepID=UPI002549431F|nr:uncharacterized protein N7474_007257 [Penicillium riverlandense]KAJ5815480.1 hypothetical protein N7474_007257 [Penicillium riverlandense]